MIIGIVGLFLLATLAGRKEMSAESASNACVQAQVAVEDRLKSPSTADFSLCDENTAKKQPDGSWAVGGYVDAENGFGAKIRQVYLVKLAYLGPGDDGQSGKWQVDDVEIADH